jgi:hypothetical protein
MLELERGAALFYQRWTVRIDIDDEIAKTEGNKNCFVARIRNSMSG